MTRLLEGLFETKPSENLALAEELATVYGLRGRAHHAKGENDKALLDFNEAIRRYPLAVHLLNRGTTYLDMGDHEKAKADIRVAKKTDPGLQLPSRVLHLLAGLGIPDFQRTAKARYTRRTRNTAFACDKLRAAPLTSPKAVWLFP